MKAYFSHYNLRYIDRDIFRASLLFYSDLYVTIDIHNIKWNDLDQFIYSAKYKNWPSSIKLNVHNDSPKDEYALKTYFDNNPILYNKYLPRLHDTWNLNEKSKSFFQNIFQKTSCKYSFSGLPIFSLNLYKRVLELYESYFRKGYKLKQMDLYDCEILISELFVSYFLGNQFAINPILSTSESLIYQDLLKSDDFPLWEKDQNLFYKKYFPFETFHQIFEGSSINLEIIPLEMQETFIPDFSEIPLAQLIEYITKDKARPIAKYIDELVKKYKGEITKNDILSEVINQLMDVSHVLMPGKKDIAIGLTSNLPSPIIINPIGIFSAIKTIKTKMDMRKKYSWVLSINELRNKKFK